MKECWFQIFIFFWKSIDKPDIDFDKGFLPYHPCTNNHQNHSIDQWDIESNNSKNQYKDSEGNPDGSWNRINQIKFSNKSYFSNIKQMNKSLISGFERNLHSKKEKINPKIDYLQYKKIRWKMQVKKKRKPDSIEKYLNENSPLTSIACILYTND